MFLIVKTFLIKKKLYFQNKTKNSFNKLQKNIKSKLLKNDKFDKSMSKLNNEINQKQNDDNTFELNNANEDENFLNRPLTRSRFKDEVSFLFKNMKS